MGELKTHRDENRFPFVPLPPIGVTILPELNDAVTSAFYHVLGRKYDRCAYLRPIDRNVLRLIHRFKDQLA